LNYSRSTISSNNTPDDERGGIRHGSADTGSDFENGNRDQMNISDVEGLVECTENRLENRMGKHVP
jgi:hypothetical protein